MTPPGELPSEPDYKTQGIIVINCNGPLVTSKVSPTCSVFSTPVTVLSELTSISAMEED